MNIPSMVNKGMLVIFIVLAVVFVMFKSIHFDLLMTKKSVKAYGDTYAKATKMMAKSLAPVVTANKAAEAMAEAAVPQKSELLMYLEELQTAVENPAVDVEMVFTHPHAVKNGDHDGPHHVAQLTNISIEDTNIKMIASFSDKDKREVFNTLLAEIKGNELVDGIWKTSTASGKWKAEGQNFSFNKERSSFSYLCGFYKPACAFTKYYSISFRIVPQGQCRDRFVKNINP